MFKTRMRLPGAEACSGLKACARRPARLSRLASCAGRGLVARRQFFADVALLLPHFGIAGRPALNRGAPGRGTAW